jgi:hypothetical protein
LNKILKERKILDLAIPCLKELFGEYQVDENQKDRPDAALVTVSNAVGNSVYRVGVEITTVDPQNALEYINEEKSINSYNNSRVNTFLQGKKLPEQVAKRANFELGKMYIADGVRAKAVKYNAYHKEGDFKYMVLLASSTLLPDNSEIIRYHVQWANYILSEENCPFDHVILVLEKTKKCIKIYSKKQPSKIKPVDDMEPTIEIMHTGFLPIGRGSLGSPTIPPAIPLPKKKKR